MDYNLLILFGIAGSALAGKYAYDHYRSQSFDLKKDSKPEEEPKHENPKYRTLQPANRVQRGTTAFDETKRKSLQPSKTKPTPKGYAPSSQSAEGSIEIMKGEFVVSSKPQPKRDYQFNFYGSQLIVGNKIVCSGLGKQLHRLEITHQDQTYIDGREFKLHPNDLEDVKAAILKAQSERV